MLVYCFIPFIVNNPYLLFQVSSGHNSVTVQNRTHVYMNFFLSQRPRKSPAAVMSSSRETPCIVDAYQKLKKGKTGQYIGLLTSLGQRMQLMPYFRLKHCTMYGTRSDPVTKAALCWKEEHFVYTRRLPDLWTATANVRNIRTSSKGRSIARAEPDGTRAETRFGLSPKRTSPFKSVGASVQSTAGSRGVRISLSNAG